MLTDMIILMLYYYDFIVLMNPNIFENESENYVAELRYLLRWFLFLFFGFFDVNTIEGVNWGSHWPKTSLFLNAILQQDLEYKAPGWIFGTSVSE